MVITKKRLAMATLMTLMTALLACSDSKVTTDSGSKKALSGAEGSDASDVVLPQISPGLWLFETQGETITYTPSKSGPKFSSRDQSNREERCIKAGQGEGAWTRGGVIGDVAVSVFSPVSRVAGKDYMTFVTVRGDRQTAFVETTAGFREVGDLNMHRRVIRTATRIGDCPASAKAEGFLEPLPEAVSLEDFKGATSRSPRAQK
jgi:hypothetical protein